MNENNAIGISEILKWGWVALGVMGGYIWRNLTNQVKENSNALNAHLLADVKSHEDFVKQAEFGDMQKSIYARFDKLDAKSDKILDRVMESVTRSEFKAEIKDLYKAVDKKQDKV